MNKILSTTLLLCFCTLSVFGQGTSTTDRTGSNTYKLSQKTQDQLLERGDSLFAHSAFLKSARVYENVDHSAKINKDTKAKMAEAFRCNAEYELAEYWYRQFVNEGTDPKTCLNFAKVLQSNDKCEEASTWYRRYLATNPVDAADIEVLADCENLKSIAEHKEVLFYNMEEINTASAEYGAMVMEDNLVFTSTRELNKISKNGDMWADSEFSDLFMASIDEFGAFSDIDRLRGSINRKFHDGLSAFDKNEYRIYFTRNEHKSKGSKRMRELKLYSAKVNKDGSWYDVLPMDINMKGYSSCHPAISASGKTLVFASNRPGGVGGMDLYMTKKDGNKWSDPINLGLEVNSPSNEIFPTLTSKNDLFFASNGHIGLGGLDIFRANVKDKTLKANNDWEVHNMGKPFNSIKDDFSLTMADDGLSGYISSNRDGGAGKDDIYRWVRTSDDPLVLDWYSKSLCISHIYTADRVPQAEVMILEFGDAIKYADAETDGSSLVEDLNIRTQRDIANVMSARQVRLLKAYKIKNIENDYDEINMKPNRDYMIVTQKEGYFTDHKLVTAIENNAVYAPCVDVELEPHRNLKGKLSTEREEVDVTTIAISLYNACTQENVLIYPDTDGTFTSKLKCSCSYELSINQFGFERYQKELQSYKENCKSLTESVTIKLINTNPFKEEKIETGKVFTLNNILYDYDSAVLTTEALVELNFLLDVLREHPTMTIDMSSYSDSRGDRDYNYQLSERRAKSAAQYLFQQGIETTRIRYVGMGENKLLNKCKDSVECTEEEHKVNRRTEVEVTSM